ncbi:DNA topoisomerase VI subunit B [Archaeoglobus veneficus]|uniref:Type 2 DNA topoisomerase 6 subunit B n=1 Tax=Archaeoglobus veneficus (strain DSM 11195 / SNP6) TaxID=693661 RepID=F2KT53_ARCVS|nr:DNA topoisomerase VI subunit B [Archaeoglobus veneficus]AEA47083.1 Type 2 DNA topoisomerase 6 subunit B [Archaeoglobus veneficus SNP6]
MKAEELAKKQKEISIAEFFEKNKHILGYSNPAKAVITCVKEAVDNSLDACEEAGILPDIFVKVDRVDRHYRIVIEDNGPGIIREQIPKVFGKLLYGSRFHAIRQSRGQQGIGISAAVLYAQLTTGKPAVVTSKTSPDSKAVRMEIFINTRKNEPEIVSEEEVEWLVARGTRIELEIAGSYVKERKQSVFEYLRETSVVNPHAKITFVDPDGEIHEFPRVSEELPPVPKEIKPHPHGIELGQLMAMLRYTKARDLRSFLKNEFVRVGDKTAEEVISRAGLSANVSPQEMGREEAVRLLQAFSETDFLPPPTDCLSPIGESLIMKSLMAEYKPEWVYAVTRKPKVHSGHPFLVEVGIAYGGEISEDRVTLLRYANKIPLLYQQGGCALTKAVESVNWKNYGLQQTRDELPSGRAVILVHLASTNIPYTSESKEAVAAIPEIIEEVRLALQEAGRRLREYLERKERLMKKKKKEDVLYKVLPLLARKVCEVLEKDEIDVDRIVARIVGNLHVEREVVEKDGMLDVTLRIFNFTKARRELKVYEMCSGSVEADNAKVSQSTYTTVSWDVLLNPGESIELKYTVKGRIVNRRPLVGGVDAELLSGAEPFGL